MFNIRIVRIKTERVMVNNSTMKTEKTIGVLHLVLGCFVLWASIATLNTIWNHGVQHNGLNWETVSFGKVFKMFHFQWITGVLTLISGLLLLFHKRAGWITAILAAFFNGVRAVVFLFATDYPNSRSVMLMMGIGMLAALCFLICFMLLGFDYREKYRPTNSTWMVMAVVTIALLLDLLIVSVT